MATLIPSIGACVSRMTSGERRLAERLEQKLDDDYLLWYDVPVGPKNAHPNFVVMHPSRGLLVLEVKDWQLATILQADKQTWQIIPDGVPKNVINPMEQARQYAHEVIDALQRDAQLVQPDGSNKGKLAFPWSYGVVFSNITRKQFGDAGFGRAIEKHRVICQDEMLDTAEAEDLQSRLWDMFPFGMRGIMSLPQLDRVRWILFPEVRVAIQGALFKDGDIEAELPSIMRVMDLQQEQLARSLGDGHRVIHGVAGSGKTMILGCRAEYLAKASKPASKPILILCINEPLAAKLASLMEAKNLERIVHVRHFHKWCRDQLAAFVQARTTYNLPVDAKMDEMVTRVIHGVDRKQIPSGQYQAILIDEGHDFAPEWLKLLTQMVDPATNNLLLLYDDAQSIYERSHKKNFSFKSVGIHAQGRTTILKINYRNTRQILQTASLIAADLLTADDKDDDGIPLLKPISCGRDGEAPLIIRSLTLRDEANKIAELFSDAHKEGHAWGDMAIICRHQSVMDECASALARRKLPYQLRRSAGDFKPGVDNIKLLTMQACKGLEFPVVALPGVGEMPMEGEDEQEEMRLFYVGATRATHKLMVTVSGSANFGKRLNMY
jgi:hypothetical protein